jgi:hypothetical protein
MIRSIDRIVAAISAPIANVNATLGDGRVICAVCGATLDTFAEGCTADLDVACEGFRRIDAARRGTAFAVTG